MPRHVVQRVVSTLGCVMCACSRDATTSGASANSAAGTASVPHTAASSAGAGNAVTSPPVVATRGPLAGAFAIQPPNPTPAAGQAGVGAARTSQAPMSQQGSSGTPATSAGTAGSSSAPAQSSGCGIEPIASGSGTIQVDGMDRTYQFSVPPGYDKSRKYPLLFAFHGAGVPASAFRTYFNMTQVVGPDALVVYPEALGSPMAWNPQRDVPLFDALLTQFKSQYCVDETHVFAAGHSSGGFFTHALGCQRGNMLRGIGPLSAGPPFGNCVGQLAVWISQGKSDPTVKVESGQMARDFWAKRNHCDTTMSKPVDPTPTVEYAGCDAGFSVRYCEYEGEHNLPDYAPKGIWDFFKTL